MITLRSASASASLMPSQAHMYWQHLEPRIVHDPTTVQVKLYILYYTIVSNYFHDCCFQWKLLCDKRKDI